MKNLASLFGILTSSLIFSVSCSHGSKSEPQIVQRPVGPPASVVLVHGSHFDSTVWSDIVPHLSPNRKVTAVTLPGRQPKEKISLLDMAKNVCDQVTEPSVLVGHSFGGAVINQMVGLCAEKIKKIVYVSGLVPLNTEKPFDAIPKSENKIYQSVAEFKKDRIYPRAGKSFYNGMDAGLKSPYPGHMLYSESYAPGEAYVTYEAEVFEKIPKAYIFTNQDKIVPLATQQMYVERAQIGQVASVESGHLPMLSRPEALSVALLQVIDKTYPPSAPPSGK